MGKKYTKAIQYLIISLTATGINLLTQFIFFSFYPKEPTFSIFVGMGLGTLTGLLIKYPLDKRFIFHYKTQTRLKNLKTLVLYISISVVTTLIFWGTELLFLFCFRFLPHAELLGGAVGLSVGYTAKYLLDKRFVFNHNNAEGDGSHGA